VRIAQAERKSGRPPFIVRLSDAADPFDGFEAERAHVGEVGRTLKRLRAEGCDAVCFAGHFNRPNFAEIKPDMKGASLLPKVLGAARRGDGAIIDVIVGAFEREGFRVVGAEEAANSLKIEAGSFGSVSPSTDDIQDMRKASAIVSALGRFDVGQGCIVRQGFVLAIEAAEGTDAMLARCRDLPGELKGYAPGEEGRRLGVLLKRPKPGQELRVDLPTIGVRTVEGAASAGLAGIAVRAGQGLIVDREAVTEAADRAGIFVYGFTDEELA
jgi:DUF1009 family protein